MFQDKKEIEKILSALGEQLEALNATVPELVVCGGSALNVLGLVKRATKDVDVVAFTERNSAGNIHLKKAEPFPRELDTASQKVARDFNLPEKWLNPGPTSVVDFGLPEGLMNRVETRAFGKYLTVHFLSRYDPICFKLYASVDQGMGKHYNDLLLLEPDAKELEEAARWSMTHDVSENFRQSVKELLIHMGHKDVAERF
ncbi:MAG: hypothetical protein EPN94_00695 [Nitrospirae bacterium]|nr:MAG: hypothetical protein EPN94_00695 [Nitrospirota bacterium]